MRLFPAVANLPLRHPAMLAKEAATIDVLSGGRFELGLGAGAFWEGIEAFGGPRRSGPESVDALEEAIAILRACWSGERSVTFEGEHYRVRGMKFGPAARASDRDLARRLRPADDARRRPARRRLVPSLPRLPLDELPGRVRMIEEAAERAGRDPKAIRRIANLGGEITDGPVAGWLHGLPSHWIEELAALRDDHGFDGFLVASDQAGAVRRRGRSRSARLTADPPDRPATG